MELTWLIQMSDLFSRIIQGLFKDSSRTIQQYSRTHFPQKHKKNLLRYSKGDTNYTILKAPLKVGLLSPLGTSHSCFIKITFLRLKMFFLTDYSLYIQSILLLFTMQSQVLKDLSTKFKDCWSQFNNFSF